MNARIPTTLLAVAVLVAAATDLAVSSSSALATDEVVASPIPAAAPPEAFLTGPVARGAAVGGVKVVARQVGDRYALVLANPTDEPKTVALQVDILETRGSELSRMGPTPVKVASEKVEVKIPAGGKVRHLLAHSAKTGDIPEGSFYTVDFAIRDTRAPRATAGQTEGPQVATVRVPFTVATL